MIQVPEWHLQDKLTEQLDNVIRDSMDTTIAIVAGKHNAQLIEQLPNMVMMLQRVVNDYEGMFNDPTDSHIYTDILKVLDDAEYKEVSTN